MNGPSKPLEKKGFNLFVFLSCCSSPDVDGEDSIVPPKRTSKQPSAPNRLSNPDKAEAHAGDSSTAESRDPADYADEKALAATADRSQAQKEEEQHTQVSPDTHGEGTSAAATQSKVSPTSPKEHEVTTAAANGVPVLSEAKNDLARPDEQVSGTESVATTETTPKKLATGEGEAQSHEGEVIQAAAVPPPPPPPPAPEVTTVSGGERQQWLLPPPLPHLSKRKCLVLDLDETLVHSSFKVSTSLFENFKF